MGRQLVEAVGQPSRELSLSLTEDDHVENLLLRRQILFELDVKRRAGEKVGQEQAEEPVPVHAVPCSPSREKESASRTVRPFYYRVVDCLANGKAPRTRKFCKATPPCGRMIRLGICPSAPGRNRRRQRRPGSRGLASVMTRSKATPFTLVPKLRFGNAGFETPFRASRETEFPVSAFPNGSLGTRKKCSTNTNADLGN